MGRCPKNCATLRWLFSLVDELRLQHAVVQPHSPPLARRLLLYIHVYLHSSRTYTPHSHRRAGRAIHPTTTMQQHLALCELAIVMSAGRAPHIVHLSVCLLALFLARTRGFDKQGRSAYRPGWKRDGPCAPLYKQSQGEGGHVRRPIDEPVGSCVHVNCETT